MVFLKSVVVAMVNPDQITRDRAELAERLQGVETNSNRTLAELSRTIRREIESLWRVAIPADDDFTRLEEIEATHHALTVQLLQHRHKEVVREPMDLSDARVLMLSSAYGNTRDFLGPFIKQFQAIVPSTTNEVLYVPYAKDDPEAAIGKFNNRLSNIGLKATSILDFDDPVEALRKAEAIWIDGGNTYRLLAESHLTGTFPEFRKLAEAGTPVITSSAGSVLACASIGTTNDWTVQSQVPAEMFGLNFLPLALNVHYKSKREEENVLSEPRDKRIGRFLSENPYTPVLGLRNGTGIVVNNGRATLVGSERAPLFHKSAKPTILKPEFDLTTI